MAKKKVLSQFEKLAETFEKDQEWIFAQLTNAMFETIMSSFRIEFLAFKLLPKEKYEEMCKIVADFSKKACICEKKDVTLQPKFDDPYSSEYNSPAQSAVNQ